MIKVYIASPYTIGDTELNVRTQIDVADKLMNVGFAPFVPLFSHFQQLIHPRPYQDWMDIDLEWVSNCDCVLRLKGESRGADEEVKHAQVLGIPVFFSEFEDVDSTIESIRKYWDELFIKNISKII